MVATVEVWSGGPTAVPSTVRPVPVMVPSLPTAEKLLPYLQRIDASRYYSNNGPLWHEFRDGFADYLSRRAAGVQVHVAIASSGTTAIEIALRARAISGRRFCLMPSYTFIASAHAVCNVGLEPFLLDVEETSLVLTPRIAAEALSGLSEPPAAILVISAFGAPPDISAWEVFEAEHDVPVVFDAAAAATSLRAIGRQPLCVSLHATKLFGIGEGGAIISTDGELIRRLVAMTGFGFVGADRTSSLRGGNYRISEYAAAIGLAVLAGVDAKEARLRALGAAYAAALAGSDCRLQRGVGTEWSTTTLNVILPHGPVDARLARLDAAGVQWRRWWGLGTHRHPAFAGTPATELPVTEALAPRVIGVPFHESLTQEQLACVVRCFQ
jgi:dTDP-4-amino-4,6-dideoxygalactose transaminase